MNFISHAINLGSNIETKQSSYVLHVSQNNAGDINFVISSGKRTTIGRWSRGRRVSTLSRGGATHHSINLISLISRFFRMQRQSRSSSEVEVALMRPVSTAG